MDFQPHGSHRFEIQGRIMVVYTSGPWNLEEVEAYTREQAENVASLSGQPWVLLAFVDDLGLHTPDAFHAMIETVRGHRKYGRCGTALILQVDDSALDLVTDRLETIYGRAGEPVEFFDDERSARKWLLQRLDCAGS